MWGTLFLRSVSQDSHSVGYALSPQCNTGVPQCGGTLGYMIECIKYSQEMVELAGGIIITSSCARFARTTTWAC